MRNKILKHFKIRTLSREHERREWSYISVIFDADDWVEGIDNGFDLFCFVVIVAD